VDSFVRVLSNTLLNCGHEIDSFVCVSSSKLLVKLDSFVSVPSSKLVSYSTVDMKLDSFIRVLSSELLVTLDSFVSEPSNKLLDCGHEIEFCLNAQQ